VEQEPCHIKKGKEAGPSVTAKKKETNFDRQAEGTRKLEPEQKNDEWPTERRAEAADGRPNEGKGNEDWPRKVKAELADINSKCPMYTSVWSR